MGLLWAVTAFFLQRRAGADLIYLGLVFFFLFVIVVSTFTDLDWKIIPDKVTYPLMVAAVALAPWNETLASTGSVNRWIESTIGLAFGGVCLWLVALGGRAFFGKEVMGVGDIKLLAGFGAFLGWQGALVTLFVGSVIGAVFSLVGIASGLLRRRQYIPFGPFLNGGALVAFWLATAAPHLSFAGF
jgi:leader peptidase (prepilin peptidase)/N-methyltransferase